MYMVWLLWSFVVFGGAFMGLASLRSLLRQGTDVALALNALVYLGTAAYGLPRLVRLMRAARRR
jgi:hypothetical protein